MLEFSALFLLCPEVETCSSSLDSAGWNTLSSDSALRRILSVRYLGSGILTFANPRNLIRKRANEVIPVISAVRAAINPQMEMIVPKQLLQELLLCILTPHSK